MKSVRMMLFVLLATISLAGCANLNSKRTELNEGIAISNETVSNSGAMSNDGMAPNSGTAVSSGPGSDTGEIAPIPLYPSTQESCLLQEDDRYLYFCGNCCVSKIDKSTGAETILWENGKEVADKEEYLYSGGTGLLLGDRIYFIEAWYDSVDNLQRALSTMYTDGTGYERILELKYSASDIMYLQNGMLYVDDMDRQVWFSVYEDGLLSAPDEQEMDYFKKIYYTDNGERVLFPQQALEEFDCYMEETDAGYIYSVNPETGERSFFDTIIYLMGYNNRYLLSAAYEDKMSLKLLARDGLAETALFEWEENFDVLHMDEEYVYIKLPLYENEQSSYSYERIALEDGARETLFVLKPSELSYYYGGSLMDEIVQNGYIYYVDEQDYSFYRMRRRLDAPENVEIIGEPVYETGIGTVGTVQSYHKDSYSDTNPEQVVYTVDLTWLAVDDKFPGANLINTYLNAHQEANMSYAWEQEQWDYAEEFEFLVASELSSHFSGFSYFDNHYISFIQQEYEYQHGAAHGMPWWVGFTFDLETGERLLLSDILYNSEDELKAIVARYFAEIFNEEPENFWENAVTYVEETINYESAFYLTEEGITFYFGPYELACYAAGFQEVTVPYEEFDMRIILENAVK